MSLRPKSQGFRYDINRTSGCLLVTADLLGPPALYSHNGIHTLFRAIVALAAAYLAFVYARPKVQPLID